MQDFLGATSSSEGDEYIYFELIILLQSLLDTGSSLEVLRGPLLNLLLHCRRISLSNYYQTFFQKQKNRSYIPFLLDANASFEELSILLFTFGPSSSQYKYCFKPGDAPSELPQIDALLLNLNVSAPLFIRSLIAFRIKSMLSTLYRQLHLLGDTQQSSFLPNVCWDLDCTREPSYISGTLFEFGPRLDHHLLTVAIKVCPFTGHFLLLPESSTNSFFCASKSENFSDVASDVYKAIYCLLPKVWWNICCFY